MVELLENSCTEDFQKKKKEKKYWKIPVTESHFYKVAGWFTPPQVVSCKPIKHFQKSFPLEYLQTAVS